MSISPAMQTSRFRTGVDLISLSVTVTTPGGQHIGGLSAEDFQVFEDGRAQELTFFSRASTALSVALLIDSSSSMESQLPLVQRAATDFVVRLRPSDQIEVVDFDSRVEVLQAFTRDQNALRDAIKGVSAGGSTALYNAVYIAIGRLRDLTAAGPDEPRRQVIVVLSDGEDTSSLVTFDQLLDAAKRAQTTIYAINLGAETPPRSRTPQSGDFTLRQLAQETGGRLFAAKRPDELSDVYGDIANELSSQYVIGYQSNNPRRDGAWRRISVRVQKPNLLARTRAGYYAPAR